MLYDNDPVTVHATFNDSKGVELSVIEFANGGCAIVRSEELVDPSEELAFRLWKRHNSLCNDDEIVFFKHREGTQPPGEARPMPGKFEHLLEWEQEFFLEMAVEALTK